MGSARRIGGGEAAWEEEGWRWKARRGGRGGAEVAAAAAIMVGQMGGRGARESDPGHGGMRRARATPAEKSCWKRRDGDGGGGIWHSFSKATCKLFL
jgi:hypothetical protein